MKHRYKKKHEKQQKVKINMLARVVDYFQAHWLEFICMKQFEGWSGKECRNSVN